MGAFFGTTAESSTSTSTRNSPFAVSGQGVGFYLERNSRNESDNIRIGKGGSKYSESGARHFDHRGEFLTVEEGAAKVQVAALIPTIVKYRFIEGSRHFRETPDNTSRLEWVRAALFF